jgi:CBS domain-containing protein
MGFPNMEILGAHPTSFFEKEHVMNLMEIVHAEPVTMRQEQPLANAVAFMEAKNVGAVVVIDDERKIVGIITDRDIALALGSGQVTTGTPVADVMTREVHTIWQDQGIFNATQYMMGHKVRRLPIIDRQEHLVGMVTADDLIGLFARELLNVATSLEPALGIPV